MSQTLAIAIHQQSTLARMYSCSYINDSILARWILRTKGCMLTDVSFYLPTGKVATTSSLQEIKTISYSQPDIAMSFC